MFALIVSRCAWRPPLTALLLSVLTASPITFAAGMSGAQATNTLGDLREGNRQNAIAALARSGQVNAPISTAEAAAMLAGTTQGARAASIDELARMLKANLSGPDLALILGPATDLTDGNRANAVAALARAKRFGPSIGGDAGPALNGATQGARATAIGEMAPYFRTDMRGQDVAAILGSAQVLSEGNRANAIAALARAGRMPRDTTGADAEMMLVGATQGARATAIGEMAAAFKSDLSGPEISRILGANGETTEGNRYNALAALVRAGKVRGNLGTQDTGTIVQGMSGATRAAALNDLAGLPGGGAVAQPAPTPDPPGSTARPATPAPCDAPNAAIDKPAPTCRERWQTVVFRQGIVKVFSAANANIDAWEKGSASGTAVANLMASVADIALLTKSLMKEPDVAKRAATLLTKGNSALLMMGLESDPDKPTAQANVIVRAMRSGIEALVEQGLTGKVDPASVIGDATQVVNNLFAYANTVRYSRMRNTFTVALAYLDGLYRLGGDQAAFAQSLGLPDTATIQECIVALNAKRFRFPTLIVNAASYNPAFAEQLVHHWISAIADVVALKVR